MTIHTPPAAALPAVRLESVTKVYGTGGNVVRALDNLSVTLPRGTFTAVMGPSGSGKSTFLQCAAGLDRPTSGQVWLGGTELGRKKETALTEFRREHVGFVFQAYNLISWLTVEENITLPLRLSGRRAAPGLVREVAAAAGLNVRLDQRPSELSGGQQQRVAIARALVTGPEVMFLDEPTGALDIRTARQVLQTLRQVVSRTGQTAVMVTHDPVAASFADAVVFLADGRPAGSMTAASPSRIAERMTILEEGR
ncbi:MAG TPA: ABC transporter ATP-binding protein [Trebonia sp.]|nr:ABC transporter ATP-binding protein [Trebonia sp.]